MKATSNEEYGYFKEGEPTDAQLALQDTIDNSIQVLFDKMRGIYNDASGQAIPEVEHDIDKLSQVRELVESLLELPDIY